MASIYERMGGEPAVAALTHHLHERCVADPVLNHAFGRADLKPDHLDRLGSYLAEAFGGPNRYSGSYGGESVMQRVHAGNEPDDEWYGRFLGCFVAAMDDAGLPGEPALRDALRSYMADALKRMKAYAPKGSAVPLDLPMPLA